MDSTPKPSGSSLSESIGGALPPPAPEDATDLERIRELFQPAESAASGGERYERLQPHARGGIGQVWLARDLHLGRDVALKELRPDAAVDADMRARFVEEARVTGQLEHPGIVPVYEMVPGPPERGPFYVMRFVKGRTLSAAIAEYHQRRQAGSADPVARNALLNAFVGVCQTVAYAHARGVLHRDLKGQNILLGDFGEVIVLDWGLAKRMGSGSSEPASPAAVFRTEPADTEASTKMLGPKDPGDSPGVTRQGQVMGTPAYMAPEQAAGRGDLIDARTDVYGLGAILYEVLTGRPPFTRDASDEASGIGNLLRRIREEAPVPPRQLCRDAPAPLEAVCLRALAKNPSERYASAAELAAEVQRWLADEPVAAYREPVRVRLGRWVRRHRTFVSSLAVLLVAAVVALSVTAILIGREQARTAAEAARARENFRKARDAVDNFFVRVSEERLLNEPGMQPLRRELLQMARKYYDEFVAAQTDDPELQVDLGRAYYQVAMVLNDLGEPAEAIAAIERALDIFRALSARDLHQRADLGRCLTRKGAFLFRQQKLDGAEAALEEGKNLLEQLRAEGNRAADAHKYLAYSVGNLALLYQSRAQRDPKERPAWLKRAEAAHGQALDLYKQLVDAHPKNATYRDDLAGGHSNLARYYHRSGQTDRARPHVAEALAIHQSLVRDHPHVIEYQRNLAKSYNHLAVVSGQSPEALTALREALKTRQAIAARNPSVPQYQVELADLYHNLGIYHQANRDVADSRKDEKAYQEESDRAEAAYKKTLKIFRELARTYKDDPQYEAGVGVGLTTLGDLALDDAPQTARDWYTQALKHFEPLYAKGYRVEGFLNYCRNAHWGLASLEAQASRWESALAHWKRALEIVQPPSAKLVDEAVLSLQTAQAAGFVAKASPAILAGFREIPAVAGHPIFQEILRKTKGQQ